MAIAEAQLQTWSGQGAIQQSASTYATIKRALEDPQAAYQNRNFQVFLQGSYGNDTNIYAESDVDVVIRYDGAFFHDADRLPADQRQAFGNAHPGEGDYPYRDFKSHAEAALRRTFGSSVTPGKKAFKIAANGSRRSADVVVAFEYRHFLRFNSYQDSSFYKGIYFLAQDGTVIANYPKQHSDNLTAKQQATGSKFKPVVRIFKNIRSRLVDEGRIQSGTAPSYFVEGLLYNVPNEKFASSSYQQIVLNVLNWLYATSDKSQFVCANCQHYLLRDGEPVSWPVQDGERFINEAIALWNRS